MILISHFYIIQSLKKGERRTGDEVYQQMNFACLKVESKGGFKPILTLYDIHSRTEFLDVIGQILNATRTAGVKPLLHFEMHGTKEGLGLSDDTLITWAELKEPIRAINILSGNNLFVSLATCYGAYFLKLYTIWEPCPFCGYIGSETTVEVPDVEVSFSEFYKVLIETTNFFDAIQALQQSVKVNSKIYNYLYCEAYFDMLIRDFWVSPSSDPRARKEAIERYTEHLLRQNPNLSRKQATKRIDRLVTSGKIENDMLSELKEVFLHKRTAGKIYDKAMIRVRENLNKLWSIG